MRWGRKSRRDAGEQRRSRRLSIDSDWRSARSSSGSGRKLAEDEDEEIPEPGTTRAGKREKSEPGRPPEEKSFLQAR